MNEPFIHVRRIDGGFEVKGRPNCALGHKIQNPARIDVDGIFVDWDWNGISLHVRNDRYGFYPVYYFANSEEIAISTSVLQLLEFGVCRELNYKGLAAFLYFGSFLGEDTPFRDIKALPPNANLVWRNGRLSVSGRITIAKAQRPSRDDAIDCYISLFRAAISRRLPQKPTTVVPLSGGRDSRHITLELCRQGVRPDFCLTSDFYPGVVVGNETPAAALVCRSLGVKHISIHQTQPRISAEMRKNLLTGFTAGISDHSWVLAIRDYLEKGSCAIYDGIGGDILSQSPALLKKRVELIEEGNYRELGRDVLDSLENGLVEKMFSREMASHLNWEAAFERFEEEFLRHLDAPNPLVSFYFWNRTRRHIATAPYALLGAGHDVYSPYLDNELFDFLASLPASLLLDLDFHTDTIHRAFPAFGQIPWAEMKVANKSSHRSNMKFARDTLIYLSRRKSVAWMRRPFLVSRLTRCLFDASYSPQSHWVGATAVYFAQLEETVHGEVALSDDLALIQPVAKEEEVVARKTVAARA